MIASLKWLAAALVVSLPLIASAQGSDAEYCRALTAKYEYFLTKTTGHNPRQSSIDGSVAVERCKSGDTAAGIPVLERKLRDAKIDLPKRS